MSNHWLMNASYAFNSTVVNMNGWAGDSANGRPTSNLTGFAEDPAHLRASVPARRWAILYA